MALKKKKTKHFLFSFFFLHVPVSIVSDFILIFTLSILSPPPFIHPLKYVPFKNLMEHQAVSQKALKHRPLY